MFIEIKDIKKHYGEGDSRVDVLNGIDISELTGITYKIEKIFSGSVVISQVLRIKSKKPQIYS